MKVPVTSTGKSEGRAGPWADEFSWEPTRFETTKE